ncbi:hypothetical protein ARMSODRAFT_747162 [Armillaria solidipes]|uniref:Uncharacterized protein n=1 Tax=Armillaria solidipes TaxID=1076256 RepID=A0A2H3BMS6_9AGAR|nr:hypothetical protein ARMSODRAFT_747162 [Armillaria solidipes]
MVHIIALPPELISEICGWLWILPSIRTPAARALLRTHRVFLPDSRSQLFVYMMLRSGHDLESWIPFLQSSPEVLMTYKTIFIDYPVISDLHFVSNIFSLRADMAAAPLRLVLHRVVIRNFLQAMDIAPCSIFDTVFMYRCVYNEDDLRMLFTCFRNVRTWTFLPRPRSTYTGHCGHPLPPILNVLTMPPLISLTLCPEFGDQFSCQSQTWLEDLSRASCHLEYLHIAFKAVDVGIVVDLLSNHVRDIEHATFKGHARAS